MVAAETLKYRAFLSYAHADVGWAKWLHRRLEGFRIDDDIAGRETPMGPVPKRLAPIFRGREDFSGGHRLTDATVAVLNQSAALIVLCSKVSSTWPAVNEEVRLFRSCHSDRPVIPLILDGKYPENLPPALRSEVGVDGVVTDRAVKILGADVRDGEGDGRGPALAKVVAGLTGVSPIEIDKCIERQRRRAVRIRNAVIVILVVLAVAVTGSAGYAWQQLKTNEAFLNTTLQQLTKLVRRSTSLLQGSFVPLKVGVGILEKAEEMLQVTAEFDHATPDMKQREIQMLVAFADSYRSFGNVAEAERRMARVQQLASELVLEDPNSAQAQSYRARALTGAGDIDVDKGELPTALTKYRDALAIIERLAKADPGWQRHLSVAHNKIGDVLRAQGNFAGALEANRAGLTIAEHLATVDPDNVGWQHDLSLSHNKIGDVLRAQSNLPGALEAYRAGLATREPLAKADPRNVGWQHDLTVSHNKIGDVLRAQGNLPGALEAYRAALAIAERLAKADPANAGWQSDLSASHSKIGDMLRAQGDLPGALEPYRAGLAIAERLAKADPDNAGWQRDLSVAHNKIGDVLRAQGNLPGALEASHAALAIAERLAKADPGNIGWQRDLAISHATTGDVLRDQGNLSGALEAYRAAFAVVERLAKADPGNPAWQHDVALSLQRIGFVAAKQDQLNEARAAYQRGLEIMQGLVQLSPNYAAYKRSLAWFEAQLSEMK